MVTATGHADVVQMLSQHPGTSAPSPPTGCKFEPARAPAESTVVARVGMQVPTTALLASVVVEKKMGSPLQGAPWWALACKAGGEPWSAALRIESSAALRARWGDRTVTFAFSPDAWSQRPEPSNARGEHDVSDVKRWRGGS